MSMVKVVFFEYYIVKTCKMVFIFKEKMRNCYLINYLKKTTPELWS
jgi:hypothetical protein